MRCPRRPPPCQDRLRAGRLAERVISSALPGETSPIPSSVICRRQTAAGSLRENHAMAVIMSRRHAYEAKHDHHLRGRNPIMPRALLSWTAATSQPRPGADRAPPGYLAARTDRAPRADGRVMGGTATVFAITRSVTGAAGMVVNNRN
jgi:hypothetical protein